MPRDPELALLEPNSEIIICSVCGEMIWKHKTDPITARMSLPSTPWPSGQTYGQAVQLMAEAANEMHLQTVVIPAEQATRAHMEKRHRFRLWLWDRYQWDRVLRRWFW